jgi:hypothetical protein
LLDFIGRVEMGQRDDAAGHPRRKERDRRHHRPHRTRFGIDRRRNLFCRIVAFKSVAVSKAEASRRDRNAYPEIFGNSTATKRTSCPARTPSQAAWILPRGRRGYSWLAAQIGRNVRTPRDAMIAGFGSPQRRRTGCSNRFAVDRIYDAWTKLWTGIQRRTTPVLHRGISVRQHSQTLS